MLFNISINIGRGCMTILHYDIICLQDLIFPFVDGSVAKSHHLKTIYVVVECRPIENGSGTTPTL